MEPKNHGILIAPPRPQDYILGSTSPLQIIRAIKNWEIYLPKEESQRNDVEDFLICTTMSALHNLESNLNYLMATNQLWDEALNFFHNNGYIQDGSFKLSDRFNAKLNGTESYRGNYQNVVGDCLRRDGILPEKDWPVRNDMRWTEYYSNIPINLFAKARKALWFLNIQYQWVPRSNFKSILPLSPIQVATAVCPGWNKDQIVNKCSGLSISHATLVYGFDIMNNWLNLDHYPPFKQILASDYEFPINMQYIVTVKPVTLRNGMYGANVLQLQKDLNKLGFNLKEDSDFGPKTEGATRNFQIKQGLGVDGIAGIQTRGKIKELLAPRSRIDGLCEAIKTHEGYFKGSRSWRNNNPGNLRFVGQKLAIGQDKDNFCIFVTYDDGYQTLKEMLVNACTGKSAVYNPNMTLLQFFQKYAPASDNNIPTVYAKFVADKLSVSTQIKIKELL